MNPRDVSDVSDISNKLGWSNPARATEQRRASLKGSRANQTKADIFAESILPIVREIEKAGTYTLCGIAIALNKRGVGTARGGKWHATTVANLKQRADVEGHG